MPQWYAAYFENGQAESNGLLDPGSMRVSPAKGDGVGRHAQR
ncbi:hypothetical protein BH11GEM2_BH11GEM2_27810 [soil metagenome]